jgi:hypothetical protein
MIEEVPLGETDITAEAEENVEQKRKEREAVEANVKFGGRVFYQYEMKAARNPPGPDGLEKLLGFTAESRASPVAPQRAIQPDAIAAT